MHNTSSFFAGSGMESTRSRREGNMVIRHEVQIFWIWRKPELSRAVWFRTTAPDHRVTLLKGRILHSTREHKKTAIFQIRNSLGRSSILEKYPLMYTPSKYVRSPSKELIRLIRIVVKTPYFLNRMSYLYKMCHERPVL